LTELSIGRADAARPILRPLPKIPHRCQKYPVDAENTPSPGFKPHLCEKTRNVSKKSLNAAKNPAAMSKNIAALPKLPQRFKKKAQHNTAKNSAAFQDRSPSLPENSKHRDKNPNNWPKVLHIFLFESTLDNLSSRVFMEFRFF
jgi:hypothetical protein